MRYVEVCQTLYDYEARTEEELSIRQDDVLYVIEKEDDDWWKVELKQSTEGQGPVGLVPATYLEPIQPIGRVRAEYDYEAQQEEELSFEEGDEMDLLETDDPDWFLVKTSQGHIGLAPSNYVQSIEGHDQQAPSPTAVAAPSAPVVPPTASVTSIPPPPVSSAQPVTTHATGREVIADEAQSWNVNEYDPAKKKKKKGKGSLFIGNGMICYGSETDKASPVQQYHILDVTKYLYDGKILHIEIEGAKPAVLDLQAASKSEAKAILTKIADSTRAAQASNTHLNNQQVPPSPSVQEPEVYHQTYEQEPEQQQQQQQEEEEEEEEETNCVPKWGTSLYSFEAEGEDELSVAENEQLYVLNYERTDGWWRVQKVDGEVGLVPSSYIQFDEEEQEDENSHATAIGTGAAAATAATAAAIATRRGSNMRAEDKEEIRRKREEEEHALYQKRLQEEEERERIRRREQEENERRRRQEEEEERRRRREEEEKENERRRQAQEAAKRAEAARQKQIEEDYKRKEAERKASLARSASTSAKSNRHQDLPKPDPSKIRTWTDRSGSFKVEAQFIDFHNGKLRLHKLNGVKIDVPVEKMCPDDIRWVENHTRQSNSTSSDPPTPAMPPRPSQPEPSQKKKVNERWDWFDWFMLIGIPMQASLQYASSFKTEKLDDSDIPNLTHKQMKTLGLKESHVQRIQRYIETGKPEAPEEEQEQSQANQKERDAQIAKDEEYARQLQRELELSDKTQKAKSPASTARPRPSVSAPKDVHPDLLDLIGNQLTSSSDKGKAPERSVQAASGSDLMGFNDDAWAPRSDSSPLAALVPTKTATSSQQQQQQMPPPPPPPPAQAPVPTGPSPEEIQAAEAERKRRQEEEQIQKIQLMALQKQARDQQKQLEELQKLTQQQLELQKQLAMQTGTQQQQQQQQQKMMQIQSQQQQLQQQLAQQPPQLQPSFAPVINSAPTGFDPQPTGFQGMQPTGFQGMQPTGFNSTAVPQSSYQPTTAGRPRPTPNHRLSTDPSLGQWQPPSQQLVQTGVQSQPSSSSNSSSPWQALQPQMTGFPPQNQPIGGYQQQQQPTAAPLPPPLIPNASSASAAGQQGEFNHTGLQRAQTIGAQPTGRHWGNATPANPFGSPTLSPLQAQMTGVQFSTPSPQAFHQSPLQSQPTGYMQPQMTGFPPQQAPPPPAGNNIFTPQGSMQYGQSAFPAQRPW